MHRVRFRSAIWIGAKIDSFRLAIWFRSAIPISKPNPIPNPNPIANRNPNDHWKPNTKPAYAKPDARTKKYIAVVHNYCSTKTTHLQAENKYITKANPCIRLQMSDHSFFGITWIIFKTNWTKWRRQLWTNIDFSEDIFWVIHWSWTYTSVD